MAAGMLPRICAALTRVCDAWNSASAWMIFARRSRSASACLAMARTMFSVSSTVLISTLLTLIPQVSVWVSRMLWTSVLSFFRFVELMLPQHGAQRRLREHVCGGKVGLNLKVAEERNRQQGRSYIRGRAGLPT